MKKMTALLCCFLIVLTVSGCGHTHKWVEATCTEPKTCTECGETEGDPLGHDWKEATCTEPKPVIVAERPKAKRLGMIGRNRPTTNQRLANDAVRPREKVLSRKPMTLLKTSRKTSLLQTDIFI